MGSRAYAERTNCLDSPNYLKTPLTVIQGNTDFISETELDEEQRLYAGYQQQFRTDAVIHSDAD